MNKQQLQQEIEALQKQLEEKQKALAATPDKWEPNGGEWWITHYGSIENGLSTGGSKCFGSEYPTRQQAEKAAKAMRAHNRLLAYVAEFAPDYESKFLGAGKYENCIVYSHTTERFEVYQTLSHEIIGTVFMPFDIAVSLCKKLNSGEVEL